MYDLSSDTAKRSFLNQDLASNRFSVTTRVYIALFSPLGLVFLVMGTTLLFARENMQEYSVPYGQDCIIGDSCDVTIEIKSQMKFPVGLLFELKGFYLNHWHVMRSRDDKQLLGQYIRYSEMKKCYPKRSEKDDPSPNKWLLPCGIQATSFFNDTFEIIGMNILEDPEYPVSGIIPHQLSSMYVTGNRWLEKYSQWPVGHVQKRFASWMDTPAFSTFRRVWGISSQNGVIPEGNLTIRVENNWDAVKAGVTKSIIISSAGKYPTSSKILGIMYLAAGGVMQLAVIIALLLKVRVSDV